MDVLQKHKLLIVDGDAERRSRLADFFHREYAVVQAYDGQMALELLHAQGGFSAVLLRCRLFEVSGFDVLIQMNLTRFARAVPVIAMGAAEDELKALSMGATAFIREPEEPLLLRSRLHNLLEVLHAENSTDPLTGVYSRQKFLTEAARLIRSDRRHPYVLIYTNIERFRVMNNLYGQVMGDRVLCALSDRLSHCCVGGAVCRVGNDHFAVCCPRDSADTGELQALARRITEQLRLRFALRISYGIYEIEDPDMPVQQMCDRAQMALSRLKESDAASCAFYHEELRRGLLEEQEITDEMESALAGGQFHIYLQPIYSLSTEAPVCAEALVRWIHPQKGVIPPGRFIPIFERNGFITKLDAFVRERVFEYLRDFKKHGFPELPISVNVSRVDLYDPALCDTVAALADRYGVDRSMFRIEITESAYMDNPAQLLDTVKRFNAAGFSVLMDDFGSGYSSLSMLVNIPVSTLKIDMEFVRDVGLSERSNSMMTSVIRMAKWLEMTVIAEGVEDRVQLDYLRSVGCDRVQGYYYSKPLPIEEFHGLISDFSRDQTEEPRQTFDTVRLEKLWKDIMDPADPLSVMLGAVGLYKLSAGGQVDLLAVNNEYYQVMRTTPDRLFREANNALGWSRKESQIRLREAFQRAGETKKRQDLISERYISSDHYVKIFISILYFGHKDDRELYLMWGKDFQELEEIRPAERPPAVQPSPEPPRVEGRQILIVEDNQVNRLMLKKMLSGSYGVLEASNGAAALKLLSSRSDIAAILLDIIMPVMDGFEFLEHKRRDDRLRGIPTLVLSQAETRSSELRALSLGASGFVRKPYEPAILRRRLEELIAHTELHAE
ncbi:MAG: EAL domain-containing protein [Oscillibacter sp.]|nr:EAL domain-containing protein [Oscillibacter sp.]